jgi:hypothetical protein
VLDCAPRVGVLEPEEGGGGAGRVGVILCFVFLPSPFGLAVPTAAAAVTPPAALTVHDALRGAASSPEDSGVSSSLSSVRSMTSRPRRGGAVRNKLGDGVLAGAAGASFFGGFGEDAAAYKGDMKDTPLGAVATNLVSFFFPFPCGDGVDVEAAEGPDAEELATCERGRAALGAGTERVRVRGGVGTGAAAAILAAGADAFLVRGGVTSCTCGAAWAGSAGVGRKFGACVVKVGLGA